MIAYSIDTYTLHEEVWTVDPSAGTTLFQAHGNIQGWSPDGRDLLLQGQDNRLEILNIASGSKRRVPRTRSTEAAAWSPDGRWIAFEAPMTRQALRSRLYVEHPDGTAFHAVGSLQAKFTDAISISWSPDRTKLAVLYDAIQEASSGLWVIPVSGSPSRHLALMSSGDIDEFGAVWSPGSNSVAYTCQYGHHDSVSRICTFSGSHLRRRMLTPPGLRAYGPAWSPTGSEIAFTGVERRQRNQYKRAIFVVDSTGSGLHRVSPWREQADFPSWSPDGNQIAYVGGIARTETRGKDRIPILDTGLFVTQTSGATREREILGSFDDSGPNISNDDGGRTPITWQPG